MSAAPATIFTADKVKEFVQKNIGDDIEDDAADILAAMAEDILVNLISGGAQVAATKGKAVVELEDLIEVGEEWNILI